MKKTIKTVATTLLFILTTTFVILIILNLKNKNILPQHQEEQTLTLFNWGEYLEPSIIEKFEKETHIKVKQVLFSSNELAVTKIKSKNQYDLAILSEYAIDQLRQSKMLETIDNGKLIEEDTHYYELNKALQDKLPSEFNNYAVPYFWGKVVILYNKNKITQDQINELKDPNKGFKYVKDTNLKVALCNNARDGLMVGLKATEGKIANPSPDELNEAKKWLLELKEQKPNLAFINDQLMDRMKNKNNEYYNIVIAYSGDANFLKEQNNNLDYFSPTEGTNVWVDALVMPKGSKKTLAYKFINFLRQKENYENNLAFTKYNSPYVGLKTFPGIPKIEIKDNDEVYKYDQTTQKTINTYWNDIIAFPSQKDYWLFILSFFIFLAIFIIYFHHKFKNKLRLDQLPQKIKTLI
ncbi:spermidine/putrescine ABC transporter substrate-binding protein [Hydrangea phyllody phytoplasma]|uniref:Spermidine/putrescine ABC transporter substrate-binding protein n=2 Tax=16SrI (Aster yellows group) TaxID=3042590 RepID=A0ABQ5PS96_9MOLU|nr:ABC transporter substrate-binding protein [Hydrangea phyllody phytoplasma]GFZ75074.1 spermidine/putrescine ABC transporter substrate-binding protein [Hydrangea phyllody phytoplasma]GLH61084.1 spermidine/putrescine ABC transporter substrate-binding protein [Rhus yellows phytoplasma]GLH61954.1 spermidine/putrescine ABC transporter substrate-binding protein [Hydrangea phyllody phytoplasma]